MSLTNKVFAVVVLICMTITTYSVVSYKKIKAENLTLQEAIKKPSVVQKPKYIFKEKIVYKTVDKPMYVYGTDEEAYSDMAQMEEFYKAKIAELESRSGQVVEVEKPVYINSQIYDESLVSDMNQMQEYYEGKIKEITREVYVNEGSQSMPVIPTPVEVKDKKWTALAEYKLNDGINLGIARKVYRELSIGGSVDQDAHLGLIGQIRW